MCEFIQECGARAGLELGGHQSVKEWGLVDGRFSELVEAAEAVSVDMFAPETGMQVQLKYMYCEIIYICWTFNFVYLVCWAIH